jgi:hypothetical protein
MKVIGASFWSLCKLHPVKAARIYCDKLNRYDKTIGDLILGVSLQEVTYVTRLQEWTIEYHASEKQVCSKIKPYKIST